MFLVEGEIDAGLPFLKANLELFGSMTLGSKDGLQNTMPMRRVALDDCCALDVWTVGINETDTGKKYRLRDGFLCSLFLV